MCHPEIHSNVQPVVTPVRLIVLEHLGVVRIPYYAKPNSGTNTGCAVAEHYTGYTMTGGTEKKTILGRVQHWAKKEGQLQTH